MNRPNSKRNLDMAIRRMGNGEEEYLHNRLVIANALVAQMMPNGVLKGGSALQMRFGGSGTRATTDLDAARASTLETFVRELEERLAEGWEGFTARLVARRPAHPKGVPPHYVMQPFEVKLSYLGAAWCTVAFELGHDEIGDADDPELVKPVEASELLSAMGFPELKAIPLMPLHHQVAQKLHGASEPQSERAHDLIDLQLIMERGKVDLSQARDTCVRLFAYRKMQDWPPAIVKGENWDALYAAQAKGLAVIEDVDDAVRWANSLIARIDTAR